LEGDQHTSATRICGAHCNAHDTTAKLAGGVCTQAGAPIICPHAGDTAGAAPPATQEAFIFAADAGFTCIELDAAATADGELLVLHVRELRQLLHDQPRLQV